MTEQSDILPSLPLRQTSLDRLPSLGDAEVVILGGGVNGVATLRDLALNGISAVLLERGDFCAGASSASSRMAHGGLRYLEGREFGLVAESTTERNRLLRNAPHLVHPLEIVVPLRTLTGGFLRSVGRFAGATDRKGPLSLLALAGALHLYEWLGRKAKTLPSHKMDLKRTNLPTGLSPEVVATVSYHDGRLVEPEGLVLEMAAEALAAHSQVALLNHVTWRFAKGQFHIEDPVTGLFQTITPRVVVNAAGAWIDRVNKEFGLTTAHVRGVKGAHLVVDNPKLHARMAGRAFYYDDGTGRMVITLPVGEKVLVGTTEVDCNDPDDKSVTETESDYLVSALNGLFEDISVTHAQIVSVTTGIRPLQSGSGSANAAARDHALRQDRAVGLPVLSMVGGKWTTFRAFAEETSKAVAELLGRERKVSTANRQYPGAATIDPKALSAKSGLGLDRCEVLIRRYGALAGDVATACAERIDAPLSGAPEYSLGELDWLIATRGACRIADVVLRRTRLAHSANLDEVLLREIGNLLVARGLRRPTDIEAEIRAAMEDPRICGMRKGRRDAA